MAQLFFGLFSIFLFHSSYLMSSGYKPAPLDLSGMKLSPMQEALVDHLAENAHNIWARDRIRQGWTYGIQQDLKNHKNPRLVPYSLLDERTKKSNRDSLREAVRTMLGYGYHIETPDTDHAENKQVRLFRTEKSYAVTSGKWYFEFEVLTAGEMKVGWAQLGVRPDVPLGSDDQAYIFDGHKAQRCHQGGEQFGRPWLRGDVVGCLIDLNDCYMMFTINGEILLDDSGSEFAFHDFAIREGFVPICSVGLGHVARLNLGKDVTKLKFFPICGLQEGFEPFAVYMNRDVTLWFSKRLAQFTPITPNKGQFEMVLHQ
uniref:B30.2/SPRY domain-containing protein n=1 Tax=Eptatretus burgeri TaxID=7764 RepID=A0A8C4R1B8_EPTBU